MNTEGSETQPSTPRVRRPIRRPVEFDPSDISKPLLDQGFLGDRKIGTQATLESFAGNEPPSTLFPLIISSRDALIADGFKTLEFNGRVWQLDELTTVEKMKERVRKEQEEARHRAEQLKEEEKRKFISGSANEVEEEIVQALRPSLPNGSRIVVREEEESQIAGYGTAEQSQFRGRLTISLAFDDDKKDRVLAKYLTPWTNQSPSSARYYVDLGTYHYRLGREITINNLRNSIETAN